MLARSLRSGLVETYHDGVVAVCDPAGQIVASSGDTERPFYLRSAAKPFQALVSQEKGAGLKPVELALASASHRGNPAQVAVVEAMLAAAGLDEDDLGCPPDWPLAHPASRRLVASGHRRPRRTWHNCSGKHAGFLRACAARGWPIDGYLDPGHPLQMAVVSLVSELGGYRVDPVGVDGCGAPVLRTNAAAMARLFASLASDPALAEVYRVMHRYPALVSGVDEGDAAIATVIDAVAKGGAQGCLGVAVAPGLGVAVKSWDGDHAVAVIGAVAALERLGVLTPNASARLGGHARPSVLGGGEPVGEVEPVVDWS